MKTFTIEDIRSWEPCYDPAKHLPEDWEGTALDILKLEDIPVGDRLWVVLREDLLDDRTLRLFAVLCAKQARHLMKDERSLKALDVAQAYLEGEASEDDLASATDAAHAAATAAAAPTPPKLLGPEQGVGLQQGVVRLNFFFLLCTAYNVRTKGLRVRFKESSRSCF